MFDELYPASPCETLAANLRMYNPVPDHFKYKLMWGHDGKAEEPEMYCAGGLHPIHINELYSSCPNAPDRRRYRILHKLGYGVFSTVWFAQDLSLSK